MEVVSEPVPAVVADDRLERSPTHQLRTLLRDLGASDFGVGLAVAGREPRPRAQSFRGSEPADVADLSDEDRGDRAPDAVEGLDRLVAGVVARSSRWILRSNMTTPRS
jgi:hypothetical protein